MYSIEGERKKLCLHLQCNDKFVKNQIFHALNDEKIDQNYTTNNHESNDIPIYIDLLISIELPLHIHYVPDFGVCSRRFVYTSCVKVFGYYESHLNMTSATPYTILLNALRFDVKCFFLLNCTVYTGINNKYTLSVYSCESHENRVNVRTALAHTQPHRVENDGNVFTTRRW